MSPPPKETPASGSNQLAGVNTENTGPIVPEIKVFAKSKGRKGLPLDIHSNQLAMLRHWQTHQHLR